MNLLPRRAPGTWPDVSIIIGVKNGAGSLQRCLDSIASQNAARRETIVIDSASTDGTLELLKANARAGKVTDYVSQPDDGLYDAWNKGLRRSRGEWICFLGSDDVFHDALALQSLADVAARAGDARVVYGRVNRVTSGGRVVETIGAPWAVARQGFLDGFNLPHPGTLHRRSLFEERGVFDRSYRVAGDYEMLLRELRTGEAIFVDRIVVDMRLGGMSSRPAAIHGTLQEILRARTAHGLRRRSAGLRLALAAGWLGGWIHRFLGDRAYGWCADLYRMARGKPRIWTV
jgi:glycosyltransferase involved in cell wall biosynthesis